MSYTDFQRGRTAEEYVVQIFQECGAVAQLNTSYSYSTLITHDIDAQLGERRFTTEVKFDILAARTGNIAIEYYNVRQAKPSGILATKADLWVQVLMPWQAWVVDVAALRDFFASEPCYRDIACGGDDNAAMRLYQKEKVLGPLFHSLSDCPVLERQRLLEELLVHS